MLLLVMKHEKSEKIIKLARKAHRISIQRLTTIPARAVRLRGVLVKEVNGSPPQTRTVPHSVANSVIQI
ncbi:hypothetical protein Y032_0025g1142 [Ancylostoma ceylanicum]|uniref:Uncharacterized protein n=1 Tax=Ancylostoma ceylanicum TaxID=53326 RepID=A0A016UUG9_9BILA|nr:hypothetical protein Y032_0025g1142 [Ancylostoma ceylanicum]